MTAAWNVLKAWLVTAAVAGLLGLLGYVIGELRLASIFAFAGLLLCLSTYWMADRAIMGMLGARELPEGEDPDLHAVVARLAARAQVVKPRLYVIDRGPPLGLAAGRGVWSSTVAFTMGLLALPPAEVEGVLAHELAHVRNRDIVIQTPVVLFSSALLDLSRIGGFLERALLYVLGRSRRRASTSSCRRSASSRPTVWLRRSASRRTGSPMRSSAWSRRWSSSSSRPARPASRCSPSIRSTMKVCRGCS